MTGDEAVARALAEALGKIETFIDSNRIVGRGSALAYYHAVLVSVPGRAIDLLETSREKPLSGERD